jgi:hypothetical protein
MQASIYHWISKCLKKKGGIVLKMEKGENTRACIYDVMKRVLILATRLKIWFQNLLVLYHARYTQ